MHQRLHSGTRVTPSPVLAVYSPSQEDSEARLVKKVAPAKKAKAGGGASSKAAGKGRAKK